MLSRPEPALFSRIDDPMDPNGTVLNHFPDYFLCMSFICTAKCCIMYLHSNNPVVSYRLQYIAVSWAQKAGVEKNGTTWAHHAACGK